MDARAPSPDEVADLRTFLPLAMSAYSTREELEKEMAAKVR